MFDPRFQDCIDDQRQSRRATNLAEKDTRFSHNVGSCSNWCGDQEVVQFRANQDQENMGNDDSGFCSPPLWENSPSPNKSPSQPLLLSHHVHTSLSPKSRLQAITRGQRELMDMVRNLPESSYELSLKDLVEHHQMEPPQASPLGGGLNSSSKQSLQQRGRVKVRRQGSKSMGRSGSFDVENKGLFLKMGFPFSLQSKKRNKFAGSGSGKVSPRPEGIKGSGSGGERDWWKKKFTGSSDSYSSRISNNSGSSDSTVTSGSSSRSSKGHSYGSSRIKNGFLSSCLPFFQCRRSKCVD